MVGSITILTGLTTVLIGGDVVPAAPMRHGLAEIAHRIKHEDCRLTIIGDSNSLREKNPRMLGGMMRTWNPDHWAGRVSPGTNSSNEGIRINCSETGLITTGRPVWDAGSDDPQVWSNGQDGFIPTRGWDIVTDGTGMGQYAPYTQSRLTRMDEYIGGDWTANTPMKARLIFAHDQQGTDPLRYVASRDGVYGDSQSFAPRDSSADRPWIDWVDVDVPTGTGQVMAEVRTPEGWTPGFPGSDPWPCPQNCTADQRFYHVTQVFWRTDVAGLQIDSISEGGFTVEDHLPESGHYDDAALQAYLNATRQPNVFVILLGQNMTTAQANDIEGLWRSKLEAVIDRYRAATLANDPAADPRFLLLSPWQTGAVGRFVRISNVMYEISMERSDVGFINLLALGRSPIENRVRGFLEPSGVHFDSDAGADYFTGLIWDQIERELAGHQDLVVPGDLDSIENLVLDDEDALWLHAGTFVGPIEFEGANVQVSGWGDYETTIVNGAGWESTIRVHPQASASMTRVAIEGGEGTAIGSENERRGGGIWIDEGQLHLDDVQVEGGATTWGGAVAMRDGILNIVDSQIMNAFATIGGGLMHIDGGTTEMSDVVLLFGGASYGGGMMLAAGNVTMDEVNMEYGQAVSRGGAIAQTGGVLSIRQSQISSAQAPQDAGLWLNAGESALVDVRISGHVADQSAGGIGIEQALVYLASTSICNNQPDNITGQWVDLGQNELLSYCTCSGDLDGSNDVGVDDLLIVVAEWGPCPEGCLGDVDNSGSVGTDDILTILSVWGPCL